MLLRFSSLKTNPFIAVIAKFFVVPIKIRFEYINGRRCYNIIRKTVVDMTLFEKKLCLIDTNRKNRSLVSIWMILSAFLMSYF